MQHLYVILKTTNQSEDFQNNTNSPTFWQWLQQQQQQQVALYRA